MLPYKDPFSLAALFHLNSEPWNNVAAYEDPHSRVSEFKSVRAREDSIPLPAPEPSPLTNLIAARRSCRNFEDREIALVELAALLDAGYGITGFRTFAPGRSFARAVPSGGGLYPLELYVLTDRVSGMSRGLHHFHARDRVLESVSDSASIAGLLPDLMQQHYLGKASALIFIAAIFPRTLRKYGARGYRYVLLEAGHVGQNICLRATELGLGSLCVGGFTDRRINTLLALDDRSEGAVYLLAVGYPTNSGESR